MDKFCQYLHLNTSFSDHIGLMDGKCAAVLYFSLLDDKYYSSEITFSFLEEIITQINTNTNIYFGSGISGFGCLIKFLHDKRSIDENSLNILTDIDISIMQHIQNGDISSTNIINGISGLGLYIITFLEECNQICLTKINNYKRYINIILNRINEKIDTDTETIQSANLCVGISGVYLFLNKLVKMKWNGELLQNLYSKVSNQLYLLITKNDISIDQLEGWFAFLNGNINNLNNTKIKTLFFNYINELKIKDVDFYTSALHGLLFHILYKQLGMKRCESLSKELLSHTNFILNNNNLNKLFPFDINTRSIPIGLNRGVCGTALPLLSMKNNNYSWLHLFGISYNRILTKFL